MGCTDIISPRCHSEFCDFAMVSQASIKEYTRKSMLESCSLDPLPASVTKNCLDISLPVITKIVNLFLSSRAIPDAFKIAELLPALKKSDADFTNYSNAKRSLPSFTQELSNFQVFRDLEQLLMEIGRFPLLDQRFGMNRQFL